MPQTDKAKCWSRYWQRDASKIEQLAQAMFGIRGQAIEEGMAREPLTVAQVRMAIRLTKADKAAGCDEWSGRELRKLAPAHKEQLAQVLRGIEAVVACPSQVLVAIGPLLPKPAG